eukprot:Nk52_evm14s288 gene=Nk52_evmTU14s288
MSGIKEEILAAIGSSNVIIFSKSYCPFCKKVKAMFDSMKVSYVAHELDLMGEKGVEMQNALKDMTGQGTVPNVFIKGQHIGGCDDTLAANASGKIARLLNSSDPKATINNAIGASDVYIFSKSYCPFCTRVKDMLKSKSIAYKAMELDLMGEEGQAIQATLKEMTGQSTVPSVWVKGKHIGGCDDTLKASTDGSLDRMLAEETGYDYDLVVIGGGSGGLAMSKRASELGKKVAVLDFVKPSPQGTRWGLGGTCVNVGCIPKKLMHQAAILGHSLMDAQHFGWTGLASKDDMEVDGDIKELNKASNFQWEKLVEGVQAHIGSLNFGYKVQLREKKVKYLNAYGSLIDNHTIKTVDKKNKEATITSKYIAIATGGRPTIPDIPGAREHGISSDDLFSLSQNPGKTLVIGASYIALECAGFLSGIGNDVTVMVRSIFLRGFDQEMANKIGDYMEGHGTKFIKQHIPIEVVKNPEGCEHKLTVKYIPSSDTARTNVSEFQCDTILFAIGRDACTKELNLESVGVELNKRSGKIISKDEQTSVPNVFAIGDVLDGKPELTPVAIQAGRLLSNRLFGGAEEKMDYTNIATTVFTPLEYGAIGLSEEDAIAQYGEDNIEVYQTGFKPLEWTVAHGDDNACFCKIITNLADNERVLGVHYLGPNAGEVVQGFAIGFRLKATKADFDAVVGIHPTTAETLTDLTVTKRSGKDATASGC